MFQHLALFNFLIFIFIYNMYVTPGWPRDGVKDR